MDSLISTRFKRGVEAMVVELRAATDPGASLSTSAAEVRLIGPQTSEAKVRSFRVISDEPESLDGRDSAPAPTGYFVASVGFAENVILARQAALAGVDLLACETVVTGHWDRKGMYGIDGAEPSFRDLLIETRIKSDAPVETLADLLRLADRRNPVTTTVAKAVKVTRRLFVNDREVALEPPAS